MEYGYMFETVKTLQLNRRRALTNQTIHSVRFMDQNFTRLLRGIRKYPEQNFSNGKLLPAFRKQGQLQRGLSEADCKQYWVPNHHLECNCCQFHLSRKFRCRATLLREIELKNSRGLDRFVATWQTSRSIESAAETQQSHPVDPIIDFRPPQLEAARLIEELERLMHSFEWQKALDLVMGQEHRAGERLFVDFAGARVPVTNPETGETTQAQLFVAVLGASH